MKKIIVFAGLFIFVCGVILMLNISEEEDIVPIVPIFDEYSTEKDDSTGPAPSLEEDPYQPQGQEIKLGIFYPMSGKSGMYGQMGWKGLQLAHKERPKVLGKKVTLILTDYANDSQHPLSRLYHAKTVFSQLIEQDKVMAIIGGLTPVVTSEVASIAEDAHIPMFSPTIATDHYRASYIRGASFSDDLQGKAAADFALHILQAKTAAIIEDTEQYQYLETLENSFITRFKGENRNNPFKGRWKDEIKEGRIILKALYETGEQDFIPQLSAIAQTKPDIIYIAGYPIEIARIVKQARKLGISTPFITSNVAESDRLFEIGGESLEGLYLTTHFHEDAVMNDNGKRFVRLFHETYDQAPDSVGALSWDTYNVLLDIIERHEAVGFAENIETTNEIEGRKRELLSLEEYSLRLQAEDFWGAAGAICYLGGASDWERIETLIEAKTDRNIGFDIPQPVIISKVEKEKFEYVTTIILSNSRSRPAPIIQCPPTGC